MAAHMAETPRTPQRVYSLTNVCCLCGFSFVVKETDSEGNSHIKKLFKLKLKLSEEKIAVIRQVIDLPPHAEGVCIKCFAKTEKVLRYRKEIDVIISQFRDTRRRFQAKSPGSSCRKKRGLLAQESTREMKHTCSVDVRSIHVGLPKFREILPRPKGPSDSEDSKLCHAICDQENVEVPVKVPQISAGPAKEELAVDLKTDKTTKNVRRSLGFSMVHEKDADNSAYTGEVKLTVYYPSQVKNTHVLQEHHKRICKAILQGVNVDKVIVAEVVATNPSLVAKAVADIVKLECQSICKSDSGTLLRKKTLNDFLSFSWEGLNKELSLTCPSLMAIMSSIVSDVPLEKDSKSLHHMLASVAIGLHARNQEMSVIQYITGFVLTHGGCTLRDIERLSSIGLAVHPRTVHNRLTSWHDSLDKEILEIRDSWANGGTKKFQLIGDNWDKNILPSFRTSQQKTISLHLFNVIAVVDRVPTHHLQNTAVPVEELNYSTYIASIEEQEKLLAEMTFIFANSVLSNLPQLEEHFRHIYPKHLEHKYSSYCGIKTTQFPLGLYNCNENKTAQLIQLLKDLTKKYVPQSDGEIVEEVFFGGDRLTDERVQCAQEAMSNGDTPKERLEGFISKTEDFHRLMNFLEAIYKLTFSTQSGQDRGTVYYYRNLLNARDVKGKVKNAYRPHKMLYYTILDAMCLLLFLDDLNIDVESEIPLPSSFNNFTDDEKIQWLNGVCSRILKKYFFDGSSDVCEQLREITGDPDHPENYWVQSFEDGRVRCHFCPKTYAYVGSLQAHERKMHNVSIGKQSKTKKKKNDDADQLQNYILMLFKLVMLHKNLDSAVDMGDGERSVRSAKYELPIYNKTNKTKYSIGSIHLTALTSGLLSASQQESLIANRFINLQGGCNNNIALDEFVEMLNRDSKVACSGHQTADSIVQHSKEYPHIINITKHFDVMSGIKGKKGFHHLPSYREDVKKILKDLQELNILEHSPRRSLKCKDLTTERNPFNNAYQGLCTMIHRHRPSFPFRRLRNPHV